jgi:hypothetical protein
MTKMYIISIEAENTFDKIQHLFLINPEAIRIIRIILYEAIFDKPIVNIVLSSES